MSDARPAAGLRRAFAAVLGRDLRLALRQKGDVLAAVGFFVVAASLFPLGAGPEPETLRRIAPGLIWVMALLAGLLALERMFAADHEDGTLDLLALSPLPLELLVLAKAAAHWLTTGLPLAIAAPVLGLLFGLPPEAELVLVGALALGTPTLSLVGAIGAALTLGARRGALLVPILILPLVIPVLVFGALAVEAALFDLAVRPHLLLLAAMLSLALPVAAIAGAAALRQALR